MSTNTFFETVLYVHALLSVAESMRHWRCLRCIGTQCLTRIHETKRSLHGSPPPKWRQLLLEVDQMALQRVEFFLTECPRSAKECAYILTFGTIELDTARKPFDIWIWYWAMIFLGESYDLVQWVQYGWHLYVFGLIHTCKCSVCKRGAVGQGSDLRYQTEHL